MLYSPKKGPTVYKGNTTVKYENFENIQETPQN